MNSPRMRKDWEGYYLDGKTASRQPVVIRPMNSGLEVILDTGRTLWWPYHEIQQTQGSYAGEQVRLERGADLPEALIIPDAEFLIDLHRRVPDLPSRFHNPSTRGIRVQLTIYAATAAITLTILLYLWGIPAMAALIAPHVPVAWEEQMGKGIVEFLAPEEKRCVDPERSAIIQEIVSTLTAPLPTQPYRLRVIVIDHQMINALAAPGGYVILFRGLIDQTESFDELAGVLAHELQHILKRHSTRAILRDASTGILFAALFGDISGALAYGLETAQTIGRMRYSRQNEKEADIEGMKMLLEAGVNPLGMITFFGKIQKSGMDAPGVLQYFSTHPATGDRIKELQRLARKSRKPSRKLLPNHDWDDFRRICGDRPDHSESQDSSLQ